MPTYARVEELFRLRYRMDSGWLIAVAEFIPGDGTLTLCLPDAESYFLMSSCCGTDVTEDDDEPIRCERCRRDTGLPWDAACAASLLDTTHLHRCLNLWLSNEGASPLAVDAGLSEYLIEALKEDWALHFTSLWEERAASNETYLAQRTLTQQVRALNERETM